MIAKPRDSGYETPLNSPVKTNDEESSSEESIKLTRNDVFFESDDGNDEVTNFWFCFHYQ